MDFLDPAGGKTQIILLFFSLENDIPKSFSCEETIKEHEAKTAGVGKYYRNVSGSYLIKKR